VKKLIQYGACILGLALIACQELLPQGPADDQLLDGPVEGLNAAEHARFIAGDIAFNDEIFTVEKGLGPIFVATSCGSCHPGDGKGHPFTSLTRFGQTDATGNKYLNFGGPQLQHRAIPGYPPEQIPFGATYSKLVPPANTGLGFLEAVPDATLLQLEDPDDADDDGISGRVNWIQLPGYVVVKENAAVNKGRYIGRFGKKAAVYDLLQQTSAAYNQDIGITSEYERIDTYSGVEIDPEVSIKVIEDVVFYLKTLKAPIPREQTDSEIADGMSLFNQIGCSSCHIPEMRTGTSNINALSNRVFYPYTDLLLHDMGPGLDDGYTEGNALTSEWRTPPLWGLGLARNSQGGQYFLLHDGRAGSIEEAILMHGGEGTNSQVAFSSLDGTQQAALIKFLESL
jgi:CxxC motif-containing protein (DUF1111 family)